MFRTDDGPFYEGQNAFARGAGRGACPVGHAGARRAAWLEGWSEAKRYADIDRLLSHAGRIRVRLRVSADWRDQREHGALPRPTDGRQRDLARPHGR